MIIYKIYIFQVYNRKKKKKNCYKIYKNNDPNNIFYNLFLFIFVLTIIIIKFLIIL